MFQSVTPQACSICYHDVASVKTQEFGISQLLVKDGTAVPRLIWNFIWILSSWKQLVLYLLCRHRIYVFPYGVWDHRCWRLDNILKLFWRPYPALPLLSLFKVFFPCLASAFCTSCHRSASSALFLSSCSKSAQVFLQFSQTGGCLVLRELVCLLSSLCSFFLSHQH